MSGIKVAERTRAERRVDAVVLGMVKEIERLPTEFESGTFADGKSLEDTEVEI